MNKQKKQKIKWSEPEYDYCDCEYGDDQCYLRNRIERLNQTMTVINENLINIGILLEKKDETKNI